MALEILVRRLSRLGSRSETESEPHGEATVRCDSVESAIETIRLWAASGGWRGFEMSAEEVDREGMGRFECPMDKTNREWDSLNNQWTSK